MLKRRVAEENHRHERTLFDINFPFQSYFLYVPSMYEGETTQLSDIQCNVNHNLVRTILNIDKFSIF